MKKVLVIGCPGSGKSTFAGALHKITGLPLVHLDMLFWNPDKTTVEKSVFRERLTNVLRQSQWIIDGNYGSTLEMRLQECDTVFFLDYPLEVCLEGIQQRRGKPRTDMPWVETEEDPEFIAFVENFSVDGRPQILELLGKYAEKNIYIFTDRTEADRYLRRNCYA